MTNKDREFLNQINAFIEENMADIDPERVPGLRQLPLHKTSCKIAGSRLNSGFFSVKSCQIL